jgi:hypothetical protein
MNNVPVSPWHYEKDGEKDRATSYILQALHAERAFGELRDAGYQNCVRLDRGESVPEGVSDYVTLSMGRGLNWVLSVYGEDNLARLKEVKGLRLRAPVRTTS